MNSWIVCALRSLRIQDRRSCGIRASRAWREELRHVLLVRHFCRRGTRRRRRPAALPAGSGGGSARGGGGGGGDGAGACPATEPTLNLAGHVVHVRLVRALLQEIEGCVVLVVDEACNPGVGVPAAKSVGPLERACTGVRAMRSNRAGFPTIHSWYSNWNASGRLECTCARHAISAYLVSEFRKYMATGRKPAM